MEYGFFYLWCRAVTRYVWSTAGRLPTGAINEISGTINLPSPLTLKPPLKHSALHPKAGSGEAQRSTLY